MVRLKSLLWIDIALSITNSYLSGSYPFRITARITILTEDYELYFQRHRR